MKKILCILFLLITSSAQAYWTFQTANDEFSSYIDLSSIKKIGELVTYWSISDYEKVVYLGENKTYPYRSMKFFTEINCTNKTYKMLSADIFSERMGGGKVLMSVDYSERTLYVPPDSIVNHDMDNFCK